MSGDTTYQALSRLTYLPERLDGENGLAIAGQYYYDVYFTGGVISGVSLQNATISGASIDGGTIDGATLTDVTLVDVAVPTIPQVIKSEDYTLVLSDAGKHVLHPSTDADPRTWTIPANSVVEYGIGTTLTFVNQDGAGDITIAITTDTMRLAGDGSTGSRTLAANGMATAIKLTATEWLITGVGLT